MIIRGYRGKDFSLYLCGFGKKLEMYFRLENGYYGGTCMYIFDACKFGVKNFDEKGFMRAVEKSDTKFGVSMKELINAIKKFYPLNQDFYIRAMGL